MNRSKYDEKNNSKIVMSCHHWSIHIFMGCSVIMLLTIISKVLSINLQTDLDYNSLEKEIYQRSVDLLPFQKSLQSHHLAMNSFNSIELELWIGRYFAALIVCFKDCFKKTFFVSVKGF